MLKSTLQTPYDFNMKLLFRHVVTAILSFAILASTFDSNGTEKLEIGSRRLDTFLNNSSKANIETKKNIDDTVSPRVINGADVPAGLYPWYVSVKGNCGGSLISPEYVLTAAHCVATEKYYGSGGYVNIGLLCGQWDDEYNFNCGQKMEIIEIEDVVLHPGFPSFDFLPDFPIDEAVDWVDDIALIKLRNKTTINPVQMDLDGVSEIYLPDTEVWVAGFGVSKDELVEDDFFFGRFPDTLQHADLYTVDEHSCAKYWNSTVGSGTLHLKVDERYLCATSPNLKTSCWGDSGGPLYDRDNEVLVGNVVAGSISDPVMTCTTEGPNLYSRVSQYSTWITHTVCKNHSSPKPDFCDNLEPTASPTPQPPCLLGDITFKLDLYTDNCGWEIGWNITDLLTNTLVTSYGAGQGDIPYLESNAFYSFKECLPCGRYMFSIYDTYYDGLSGDGRFIVTVDGKVIKTLESSQFTSESVSFRGGHQCPSPPFRIISKGRTNMCIQPEENRLDSQIVVKKCKDKSLLQRWTVDWMGQHRSAKAPRRCIKVKGDQLIFQRCSNNRLKSDLSTNFIVSALHERISWMYDARKVFSLLQGNSKRVKLANFWNPEKESYEKLDRQAWSIEYDY